MPSEEKDTNKSKYTWGTLILKTKLKKINSNLSRSVSSNLPTNDYYTNKEMISKATHGLKCNRTFDKSFDQNCLYILVREHHLLKEKVYLMPSEEKDTIKSKYTWGTLILKN